MLRKVWSSALVGAVAHCELVDSNAGQAGIYGPPDTGFPDDGVVAAGEADSPGWVLAVIMNSLLQPGACG